MDIGILAVLTTIFQLAQKCGLTDYLKRLPEKTAGAILEKYVQDSDLEGYFEKFFQTDIDKSFESALKKIAPANKSIKRRFLLSILTDPVITQVIENLSNGTLPQREIFIPVFQRLLHKKEVQDDVNIFVNTLFQELKKDQEFVNSVILSMYELIGKQHVVLMQTIENALKGTVPAPEPEKQFKIDTYKLPNTNPDVFGREKELEILDTAWENSHTKILSFIAWGGVGKSALVNAWLNNMEKVGYRGAEKVYGWSFYSQGTTQKGQASADIFINDAFKWFDYSGEIPKSQHERGRLLAEIISAQKTLLILDGLEPLQHPPGEMHGFLKDETMKALLKNLARNMNGVCIITSRCNIKDIQATEGRLSLTQDLEQLSDKAGMAVLKSYNLKGKDSELIKISREFKGHALALHLVGGYLKAYHNGDIKQRFEIPRLAYEEKNGGHARRVMESYEKWFAENNKAELDILNLLGLFDRPAKKEAIDILKKEPAIKGLTERLQNLSLRNWQNAIIHLREQSLIAETDDGEPDTLDCHPLIREHFGETLQKQLPYAWKEAHERLYEYYKHLPKKELPDTLEEMEPLFAAVMHGCQAGLYNEAEYDIYWKRICRGDEAFINHKLGAFGADLSCLSGFFETLWDKPATELTEHRKAVVLSWAGFALRAVGRLSEAAEPLKAGLEMYSNNKDWAYAAGSASNLSELYLTLGDVVSAQEYGKQCVIFADRSEDGFHMESKRTTHADALFQGGETKLSETLFIEAENMQEKRQPGYPYLYSLLGFRYCDLLVSLGKYQEVVDRARTVLEIAERNNWLLDIALAKLTIGKALMHLGNYADAEKNLNHAVNGLREAGTQHRLPWALLASATFYRLQMNFAKCWTDLDEAREIAEYGQMRLHLTDYHLEACRTITVQISNSVSGFEIIENGETLRLTTQEMQARFKAHFKEAERLIEETGYHRRDGELGEMREGGV
ncbi:hypothetical protein KAR48_15610 [bacterium]|nr:hypothetical protein [bacterium]